jgi:hypothetical protein
MWHFAGMKVHQWCGGGRLGARGRCAKSQRLDGRVVVSVGVIKREARSKRQECVCWRRLSVGVTLRAEE